MELFVPGRVCLLGEHSDWAGGFRRFNGDIAAGKTIVTGTNQGLYARVRKHPSKVIVTSTDNDGKKERVEISMDAETLLKEARAGGHWSYIAGVAYKMLEENIIGGVEIDNYRTTLPLKKGLSSSAAICVLTARAFNKLYDLRLTTRGEMEYAYQGELVTPSQCGRMDQACAFGNVPVVLTYDGEFTSVEKINVCVELHLVVVDLCAAKSTPEILKALQSAYPFAKNELDKDLHRCLGDLNQDICERTLKFLSGEDTTLSDEERIEAIGNLFKEAQRNFDKYAGALCPSQLTAPVLHKCLDYEPLQKYIVGGKGVGAGGDGTAQLLCRDAEAQDEVARIVKDELKMDPILLTISPGSKIHTAVIPAGGFAGKLFPASQACKAELFPIYDPRDKMCKPLILSTVEQLLEAGLERIILVVQQEDLGQFKRLFKENVTPGNAQKLSKDSESYARKVIDMGRHVEFVVQERQRGFGDAVYCAKKLVGSHPFLLVLGHHIYLGSDACTKSCVEQMLDAHKYLGTNVIGLKTTNSEQVENFGTVGGSLRGEINANKKQDAGSSDLNAVGAASSSVGQKNRIINVTAVVEKPSLEFAKANLHVDGFGEDQFLTMFGMYALDAKIFDILENYVDHDLRSENGEIPFTPALSDLQQQQGLCGIQIHGERLAITSPEAFIVANSQLLERNERKKERKKENEVK